MRKILIGSAYLPLTQSVALAQSTPEEIRKLARNPFADEIELSFENQVTLEQRPYDRVANSLGIHPRFSTCDLERLAADNASFDECPDYQAYSAARSGGITGLGDTTISMFLTPASTGKFIWGLGPAISIPTATSDRLGSGKWGMGPAIAVLVEPEWGSAEFPVQNFWSMAGGKHYCVLKRGSAR